ncbi:MAG: hypothetical protein M1288_03965 [Actinobacteria bacterium]|jgi:hypothetical protein|nr:hypothetical protein [Actinomycetota bacterium]
MEDGIVWSVELAANLSWHLIIPAEAEHRFSPLFLSIGGSGGTGGEDPVVRERK